MNMGYSRDWESRVERFWAAVEKIPFHECWEWNGFFKGNWRGGYGYRILGNESRAHRVAWALTYGRIPKGLLVCHRCDNISCVRPDHLFLGTTAENMRDRDRKGRHGFRKSVVPAPEIRSRHANGETGAELARAYGLSRSAVSRILNWKSWRDVDMP